MRRYNAATRHSLNSLKFSFNIVILYQANIYECVCVCLARFRDQAVFLEYKILYYLCVSNYEDVSFETCSSNETRFRYIFNVLLKSTF